MKGKMKKMSFAFAIVICLCLCAAFAIFATAEDTVQTVGAMIEIEENLSAYRLGDVQYVEDDGYIGIPVQISVYHNGVDTVSSGVDGTPVIMYVVNTNTERVGTDTDTEIIQSMLDRGYLVTVVDYLENEKAVSPALDWSLQGLRAKVASGSFFSDMSLPGSDYKEIFVTPAGYDVSLSNVYWEIDKHSSAGTLEYIVEVWNEDFRAVYAEKVIKWVDSDGNRKSTQDGYDGTSPVWLNASGTEDENGEYVKIKHTLAQDVEDCVKLDGSPLEYNLYMHILYPTNPEGEVPVMCLASSGAHLASAAGTADRPQLYGYVFNGYAGVMYDYGYTPMARADAYSEFSGSSTNAVTGDNVTYSISFYNDKKINTAAMRYLRYLAASDSTYAFDTEAIGVYGNSKGGWMTYLGEEHPELLSEKRFFVGHHGESRYEAGETESSASGLIEGGEEQPWLSYDGVALDSGADFIYASCGGSDEHITDGHAPTFVSSHLGDGSYYGMQNHFINNCRNHDVPCMWFEVNLGHTFTYGEDTMWGVDTYDALFDFSGYYLKGDAVKVVYTSFTKESFDVELIGDIVVKFSGAVDESNVALLTITDAEGNSVNGSWTSQFGNTEWTFTLSEPLASATEYTLTVPASVKGDNGVAMGEDFVQTFTTSAENSTEISFVQGESGAYFYYDLTDSSVGADKYVLRFAVTNDANNLVEIYPVTDFDSQSPDSSTPAASAVASCGIDGAGVYECDVTDYVSTLSRGDTAAFLLKSAREEGSSVAFSAPLDSYTGFTGGAVTTEISSEIDGFEGTGALKVLNFGTTSSSGTEAQVVYYNNLTRVLTASSAIKSGTLTDDDMGRTFTVSFRVYDTVSRRLQVSLKSATSSSNATADYNAQRYNLTTTAGEWVEFSFDYTVYEPDAFGTAGKLTKALYIDAETRGDVSGEYPIYFDNIETVETVSAPVIASSASLVFEEQEVDPLSTPYGKIDSAYAEEEKYPIAVFVKSGDEWQFKSASSSIPTSFNYGADAVIYLRSDVSLSSSKYSLDTIGSGRTLTFDLNGYTLDITSAGQYNALTLDATAAYTFNMINGDVYSNGKASLICIYSKGTNEVNVNFRDLDITLGSSFGETSALVRHGYNASPSYTATYNIDFTDCDVDVSAVNSSSLYVFRAGYSSSTTDYVLNWTVNGGSLNTGASSYYTRNLIVEKNGNLTLGTGESGEYFKLIFTVDIDTAMTSVPFTDEDGNTRYFGAVSTDGTNYVHQPLILETEYGTIPTSKISALTYPFVGFYDGSYKSAGDFFASSGIEYGLRSLDGAAVLMRRDYTIGSEVKFSNLSHHQGELIIDFGGYTLNGEDGYKSGIFSSTGMNSFETELTLKNGRVLLSNPLINIGTYSTEGDRYGEGKSQIFNMIDLEIVTTASKLINYETPSVSNTVGINYVGCDIDMSASATVSEVFRAGFGSDGLLDTTLTVKGGTLKINNFVESKFVIVHSSDSVIFDESADKFELYIPVGTDSPTGSYATDTDALVFIRQSSDGEYDLYELGLPECEYGSYPAEYVSSSQYPILVFVESDGEYVFSEALTSLPHTLAFGEDAVLLFRADVAIDSSAYNIDSITSDTTLILDLGGNTLNLTSGGQYFTFKTTFTTPVSLVFKNGCIENGGVANLISMQSTGSAEQNVTLENIDFTLTGTGTADGCLITRYNGGSTTNTGKLNLTVKDCDIDTTANSTTALRIFQAGRYDGMFNVNYVIEGGTVKTASYNSNMFYSESGGTITFTPDANGEYTVFTVPTGSITSAVKYYGADGGELYLVEQASDATYDTYVPESLETPYGAIDWVNSSKADYPFVAFKDNGDGTYTYVARNANFFTSGGMEYTIRSYDAVVLMRRDFNVTSNLGNLSNRADGTTVTIDFGGHTIVTDVIPVVSTAKHATDTNVVIKNGTVLLSAAQFIRFNGNAAGAGKVFNYTLENLVFKYDEGNAGKPIVDFADVNASFDIDLTFNDCIFELSENTPQSTTLVYTADPSGVANLAVEIAGGSIIADSLDGITILDTLSDALLTRGEENEYITVKTDKSASAPDGVFTSDIGSVTFVKMAEEDGRSVYYLRDTSRFVTPLANLTLYSDFVYNVYVPKKDSVVKIELDGVEYTDLSSLETVTVDGVECYKLTKRVAVAKGCEKFTLGVEIEMFEGMTQTARWQLSVLSYTKKLLDGSHSDTVETLAKDILSYVRAAYVYSDGSADAIAQIDEVIGADYDEGSIPDTDVDAKFEVDALSSATLELGDAPAFRFYVDGSYDSSLYKFNVSGKAVNTSVKTDSDGRTYIRVSMYAYAMTDTVSYSIDGTDITGEYNLKTYYDFVLTNGSDSLISLVERLWKYSESALAYKNEVTG